MFGLRLQLEDTQSSPSKCHRVDYISPEPDETPQTALSSVRTAKVRGATLPQEYDLVRFISHIQNPHPSWKPSTPACQWEGVICDTDLLVRKLQWKSFWTWHGHIVFSGSLQWGYFPRTVVDCSIGGHELTGHLALNLLPSRLIHLDLNDNTFSGSLELRHLPENIKLFSAHSNQLSGPIDLVHLPPGIVHLDLSGNLLSGGINLVSLSGSLKNLDLSCNHFEGCVEFTHLPPHMTKLCLSRNQLSGHINLSYLPQNLFRIDLSSNRFEELEKLGTLPTKLENLDLSRNRELCGKINKSVFPASLVGFSAYHTCLQVEPA